MIHPKILEMRDNGTHSGFVERLMSLSRNDALGSMSLSSFLLWSNISPFIKYSFFGSKHVKFGTLQAILGLICEYGGVIGSRHPDHGVELMRTLVSDQRAHRVDGDVLTKYAVRAATLLELVMTGGRGVSSVHVSQMKVVEHLAELELFSLALSNGVATTDKAGVERLLESKHDLKGADLLAANALGLGMAFAVSAPNVYSRMAGLESTDLAS